MSLASLFISSAQKELQDERNAVKAFVEGNPLLRQYFTAFLFEDLPASDRRADEVYLDEVDRCAVYVGLFGQEYGFEDAEGVSPTEREFTRATAARKVRLIFVKGNDDQSRHPKVRRLVRKAGIQLISRRFTGISDLTAALYAALLRHLELNGVLRRLPFDASLCHRATLRDISPVKMKWFLSAAHRERNYALSEMTPVERALAHLYLLAGDHPSHAAVLLFGENPQRFVPGAEVKCLQFHGTEIRKPIPSYQIYKGTVFDQVDMAVDFVMSKITRSVGTRAEGPEAPVQYEFPKEVVSEAVVNAIAHCDYTSNAGIQVMLFADRLEVWNPGELPPTLTPERLREPHPSIPHNPLITECLYLAHYTEKAGTGTLDMIKRCREASLSEPEFEQRAGSFVITLWRDWLTAEVMAKLGLNPRQKQAIGYLKTHGKISNPEYQQVANCIKKTASRDLHDMKEKKVIEQRGIRGPGVHYVLSKKRDKMGT
jgi:ATP-dependent DNA helicase RecG